MTETPSPFALPDVAASNDRHDAQHGDPYDFNENRVPSGWNEAKLMRLAPLTDRKIDRYEKLGYYSPEYRAARRELQERKAAKRANRQGNFDIASDGRLIYRPL